MPLTLRLVVLVLCSVTWSCSTVFSVLPTSAEIQYPQPVRLMRRLSAMPQVGNGKVDHFAVLIGANTELRHRGTLSLAYQVLIEEGYDREEVFILDTEGETPVYPFTEFTTLAALDLLFQYLANVVETHDTLLVYVTGHGMRYVPEGTAPDEEVTVIVTLVLNRNYMMLSSSFAILLRRVHPGFGMVFFDQCFGGVFQQEALDRYLLLTVSRADDVSVGTGFPRAFWEAFRNRDRPDEPVSILTAFRQAMEQDPKTRSGENHPVLRLPHSMTSTMVPTLLGLDPD